MSRTQTVNQILNRVGSSVGIGRNSSPYDSDEDDYAQLRDLLLECGEELITMPWEILQKEHSITTADTDSGDYDLPVDFGHMIDQSGWDRLNDVPLFGPLSPQDWQYLLGRDLLNTTIYASFRLKQGKFSIFPQPPPDGLTVYFEYISRYWIEDSDGTGKEDISAGDDVIRLPSLPVIYLLKAKFKEAKGFDSTVNRAEYNSFLMDIFGQSKGAEILNAGQNQRSFPYLDLHRSTPDTNYGS